MLKEKSKIRVHFTDFITGKKFKTGATGNVYNVYNKAGELGIDFNVSRSPYISEGGIFVPLVNFSSTVIFEDIATGKMYHYSKLGNGVIDVTEG